MDLTNNTHFEESGDDSESEEIIGGIRPTTDEEPVGRIAP